MIVDDFFQSSQVIKTYLGFDFYLAETPCDPYPYRVRITKSGEPPTEQYWLGGFASRNQEELERLLVSYEKIVEQMHLKACLQL